MRPDAVIKDEEALLREAQALVEGLSPKEEGATLVTLSGDLGAGKTTFAQKIAQVLGVTEHVTSPTFVLAKTYALPEGQLFRELLHIDAYRLEQGSDLEKLGFSDADKNTETLILLEWPERVADMLRRADVGITLEAKPDGTRIITYA